MRRLGSERFAEREEAARELVLRGEPARAALRRARGDADPEVARLLAILARALGARRILEVGTAIG